MLMEKFIFGNTFGSPQIGNYLGIQIRLSKSQQETHYKRADFVNKLNIAFSIGHVIPFECGGLGIKDSKTI